MNENAHLLASINRRYRLLDLRRRHRLTQNEVARRMGVRQPRVSQLEAVNLSRVGISSLDAYIAALGGRLRVVADFGDEELHLRLDQEDGLLRVVEDPLDPPTAMRTVATG